jgi:hypothetical protein
MDVRKMGRTVSSGSGGFLMLGVEVRGPPSEISDLDALTGVRAGEACRGMLAGFLSASPQRGARAVTATQVLGVWRTC